MYRYSSNNSIKVGESKKVLTYEYSYSHTPGMKKSCCSSRKYLPRNGSPDMHPFVSCSMVRSFSLPSAGFRCNAHTKILGASSQSILGALQICYFALSCGCGKHLFFSGLSSGVSPRYFYCGKTTVISVQNN